jgi:hypothetical protein
MKNYRVNIMTPGYKITARFEFTAPDNIAASARAREIAYDIVDCIAFNLEIRVPNSRAKLGYSYKVVV